MEVKYVRIEKLLEDHLPISKSQMYNYINAELIPAPIKLGRTSVWEKEEIMQALKELPIKIKNLKKETV